MIKEFEVGKFYKMQVVPNYGPTPAKKVPCLCVKIQKRRIWFEHLCKIVDHDGGCRYIKVLDDRRLNHFDTRPDEAEARDRFFSMTCTAEDFGTKPSVWDDIPSAYVKKGK